MVHKSHQNIWRRRAEWTCIHSSVYKLRRIDVVLESNSEGGGDAVRDLSVMKTNWVLIKKPPRAKGDGRIFMQWCKIYLELFKQGFFFLLYNAAKFSNPPPPTPPFGCPIWLLKGVLVNVKDLFSPVDKHGRFFFSIWRVVHDILYIELIK